MRTRSAGFPVRHLAARLHTAPPVTAHTCPPADIGALPVFHIVAHSSYDYVYTERSDALGIGLEAAGCQLFRVPPGVFIVVATPVGAWGLLHEDVEDEERDGIVHWTRGQLKYWLSRGGNAGNVATIDCGRRPRQFYATPAYTRENGRTIDKGYEFFGETLTHGGFGVVSLRTWESLAQAVLSEGLDTSGLYGRMRETPKLRAILREAVRTQSEVLTSTIVDCLGPGVYISTGCSNVNVCIRRQRSRWHIHLPFASGRPLARDLYDRAYADIARFAAKGNDEWNAAVGSAAAQTWSLDAGPRVSCTFIPDTPGEFTPTAGSGGPLTRSGRKAAITSARAFPAAEEIF
jgi:hypothetical protein